MNYLITKKTHIVLIKEWKQYLLNFPGWHTNRKIVVIHSDDWGSIRMPSNKIREQLNQHSDIKANDAYCRFDTIASHLDLEALFEVLTSVEDKNGNPAIITANCVLTNPHFEKVKDAHFEGYYYETIDQTFERYNKRTALERWKEGIVRGIFIPQFHGREHVNVPFWMAHLRAGHQGVKRAFEAGVFGVNFLNLGQGQWNLQRAWDLLDGHAEKQVATSIVDGLRLFKERFGYISQTAIAPNYTWNTAQEQLLMEHGVVVMQGILRQRIPAGYKSKYQYRNRFTKLSAPTGKAGFQRRNVFFEPSLIPDLDYVDHALAKIKIAFQMGKPAIIGSHRLNFVGELNIDNRDKNLRKFRLLLKNIVKNWPEVEFLSAEQLASL